MRRNEELPQRGVNVIRRTQAADPSAAHGSTRTNDVIVVGAERCGKGEGA